MDYIIVSDYLFSEYPYGGAESCTNILKQRLSQRGHKVFELKSSFITPKFLRENKHYKFIVTNFIQLSPLSCFAFIEEGIDYSIYEHDFKIFKSRVPNDFENFIADDSDKRYVDFFTNARKVVTQSQFQQDIIKKNIDINNLVCSHGNLWSDEDFILFLGMMNQPKNLDYCILDHTYSTKNTAGAKQYCESNNFPYKIIPRLSYPKFLSSLSQFKTLVFLPLIVETLSRVCVEASILNLDIIGNDNISYLKEDWSTLKGQECLNYLRDRQEKIIDIFE